MAEQSSGEKTEEATPRRRQEARRKGTVAKSTDVAGALALLVMALMIGPVMSWLAQTLLASMSTGISRMPREVSYAAIVQYAQGLFVPAFLASMPLILAIMAVGVAANFAQVGFVLSAEPMNPTWDKMNPINGVKRLFSARTAFEGVKSVAKMVLFGWIAYSVVAAEWNRLVGMAWLTPAQAAGVLGQTSHTIMMRIAIAWLVIAALDYFFQRKQTDKQLRMTKDELRREMKEQEGSPEVKAARMQRARRLARGGLAQKLREADVLVTNPTHFAVAIKYERSKMHAPVVLAKGADLLALRMREIAKDIDLPIVENKPLARRLYKLCEAGDFVPRDLFGPVAEVLAYVYKTVKRVREGASAA